MFERSLCYMYFGVVSKNKYLPVVRKAALSSIAVMIDVEKGQVKSSQVIFI